MKPPVIVFSKARLCTLIQSLYVGGCFPFLTVDHIERNFLIFTQCFESIARDRRMVNENIPSAFFFDETIPFLIAKPFYSSCSHYYYGLLKVMSHFFELVLPERPK